MELLEFSELFLGIGIIPSGIMEIQMIPIGTIPILRILIIPIGIFQILTKYLKILAWPAFPGNSVSRILQLFES